MLQNEQTPNTLIEILPNLTGENDFAKGNIIRGFLKSSQSSPVTSDDVIQIIKDAEIKDDYAKGNIIGGFLESSQSSAITSDDVIKIIKDAEIENDVAKGDIIQGFLKSSQSSVKTSDDVIKIIKEAKIENDFAKGDIIQGFLKSSQSSVKTSDDVIKIIKEAKIENNFAKGDIIQGFLKSSQSSVKTSDDVIKIIKEAKIENDVTKRDIIVEFLKSERSLGINVEDFVKMIKSAEFKEDFFKERLINEFLKSERSPNMNPQDLANMIKGVGLQNRADLSTNLYVTKFSASENYIENFIDITKDLHPSEAMQSEFVNEFIAKNQINRNNLGHLKPFIEGLQDNELALDVIENLSGILENEKDTLNLVKNRSKKQYSFLTETFGDKDLQDCITQDGIDNLKGIFGNDLTLNEGNPITITAMISYFDLSNRIPSLSTILTPEFKTELQNNFSPSADKLLYKPQELEKLNQLLNQDGVEFDANSYFIKNEVLCSHLRKKAGVIEKVDSSKEYKINFTNYSHKKDASGDVEMTEEAKLREEVAEKERQQGINDLFNKILKQNPSYEDVDNFVSRFFGVFPPKRDDKLLEFFKDNKKELAYCLCKEDLEKDDLNKEGFISLFTTKDDGCYANISMQFKKMLDSTMFNDREDQIIYATADVKIFSVIGASQDITHEGPPLDNRVIKSYSLSPMALIEKITQEEMLKNTTVTEIIDKNIGEDGKLKLLDRLSKKDSYQSLSTEDEGKLMDKETKEIASYFIVKEAVGEEKMIELENKNPKLKEMGNFIYDRRPQLSPRESLATNVARTSSASPNHQIS